MNKIFTDIERQMNLISDLAARVSYGVKVYHPDYEDFYNGEPQILSAVYSEKVWIGGGIKCECDDLDEYPHDLALCKPYLRPMSSMTEEEEKEICQSMKDYNLLPGHDRAGVFCGEIVDWLNSHHFDYRNLIEKGLALEAPNGMYETK